MSKAKEQRGNDRMAFESLWSFGSEDKNDKISISAKL